MATIEGGRILTRVREVLEDARGTLRTISSGTLKGSLPPGLETNEEARRAITALAAGVGVPTEARITAIRRSPASPPVLGNLALYDFDLEVRQVLPGSSREKLDDDWRDAISGVAATYADIVAQALEYPGNLTATQAGGATGIISGKLAHVDSAYRWSGTVNGGGMTLEAVHRFKGIAQSAPATS